ncbi:MAG TPA: acyltransferase [Polyangiaceae bacterium]|jgi:peptidoglycan/LPS O-acetylase OafA/YrhL|nr:acyltransferase [Polyangiaceae bacterium]
MVLGARVSTARPAGQSGRFELVDALRGLAALAVVLPHAVGLFIFPNASWLTRFFLRLADYGRSSVEVFFVVSGFAIAYSLREAVNSGFSLGRFLVRRAARLDPPYWVGLLLTGLVVAIRARATHQPVMLPQPGKVLAHLFYLQDILNLGQYNVVFWTLCLEFQLYMVFAAMMRLMSFLRGQQGESRAGTWAWADPYGWLIVAAFFVFLIVSHTVWPMRPGWFVPFFYLFLSGSLAAWRTLGRVSDGLFQLCLLAMGLALVLKPELPRVLGFLTVLVIYAAIRRDALHRWLSARWAQWLGRISYSIYLAHVPVVTLFLGLRTRVAPDSKLLSFICLAAAYGFTLALASALYVTIEVPCLRLSQRLKRSSVLRSSRLREAPPA